MVFSDIVKTATRYSAARSRERSTALGGGLCAVASYYLFVRPEPVSREVFWVMFAIGVMLVVFRTTAAAAFWTAKEQRAKTPLERIAAARRQGKSTVHRGANPRLERYLANTPVALCRDEEWEKMPDVGREIVD